jgi:hypothetical protein
VHSVQLHIDPQLPGRAAPLRREAQLGVAVDSPAVEI